MSCEVEVPAALPPPSTSCDETAVAEGTPTTGSPTTTYEWLCSLPMAASAGNAVSNLYEASKNYNCVTQYTLGSVEGSVKKAASVVAPVVHKLDGPIQAVDSYTASKLVSLSDKVPSLKSEPEDVARYVSETKESLVTKVTDGKAAVAGTLSSSKDAVCSQIAAGADTVANSRVGVMCSEGKKAVANYYTQGKEAVSTRITAGRDAVYSTVQSGAEQLANTRAGVLVGAGVDRTLDTTECLVDYFVPEIENEKELFSELEKEEKKVAGLPLTRQPKDVEEEASNDDPEEDDEQEKTGQAEGSRVDRAFKISRKMRLRMFYRAMYRLHSVQQNCQSTLKQLKETVDLLKMVQAAKDGLDRQYDTVTTALKDMEGQIKQLLTRKAASTEKEEVCVKEGGEDEDSVVPWMKPPRGTLQASLDYAKQLSEKAYNSLGSVTAASRLLPSNLKESAGQAYRHAQDMYSTLKPMQTPKDLSASALTKISSVLDTQLGYIKQLGSYLSSVLQRRTTTDDTAEEGSMSVPDQEEDEPTESENKVESDEN